MGEIDFGEIQELLDEVLGRGIDFQELAEQGTKGKSLLSWDTIASLLQRVFLQELLQQKQLWMHILILAIAAAVLIHFADVFQSRNVSQISFCMIYMILFLLLAVSFKNCMQIASEVLGNMRDFMIVLAPAYLLALTLTSYVTSAGVYYEFILFLITAVQWFLEAFILPCIEIYVLLVMVDSLSKDARLSRFLDLAMLVVGWGLKAALALVMGFHMIQGLVSPAADAFRTAVAGRGIGLVPGVGELSGSVVDLALGSAMLIKNGIGAAALVVLLFLCLVPLVKLAIIMVAYYVLAAVLQPVSDERITGCLAGMGNAVRLLFQTVFTVLLLFLLTVALATAMTG